MTSTIISEIRSLHTSLAAQLMGASNDPELLPAMRSLILRIRQAGTEIYEAQEREYLRSLLRFWGNTVYKLTDLQEYPDTDLYPLDAVYEQISEDDAETLKCIEKIRYHLQSDAPVKAYKLLQSNKEVIASAFREQFHILKRDLEIAINKRTQALIEEIHRVLNTDPLDEVWAEILLEESAAACFEDSQLHIYRYHLEQYFKFAQLTKQTQHALEIGQYGQARDLAEALLELRPSAENAHELYIQVATMEIYARIAGLLTRDGFLETLALANDLARQYPHNSRASQLPARIILTQVRELRAIGQYAEAIETLKNYSHIVNVLPEFEEIAEILYSEFEAYSLNLQEINHAMRDGDFSEAYKCATDMQARFPSSQQNKRVQHISSQLAEVKHLANPLHSPDELEVKLKEILLEVPGQIQAQELLQELESYQTLLVQAQHAERQGELQRALRHLKSAQQLFYTQEVDQKIGETIQVQNVLNEAKRLIELRRYEEALDILRGLHPKDHNSAYTSLLQEAEMQLQNCSHNLKKAQLAIELGNFDEAIQLLDDARQIRDTDDIYALEKYSQHLQEQLELAHNRVSHNAYPEARAILQNILEDTRGRHSPAKLLLSEIEQKEYSCRKCIEDAWSVAQRAEFATALTLLENARGIQATPEVDETVQAIEKLQDKFTQAQIRIDRKEYGSALEILDSVNDPRIMKSPILRKMLGKTQKKLEEYQELLDSAQQTKENEETAMKYVEQALEIMPTGTEALQMQTAIHRKQRYQILRHIISLLLLILLPISFVLRLLSILTYPLVWPGIVVSTLLLVSLNMQIIISILRFLVELIGKVISIVIDLFVDYWRVLLAAIIIVLIAYLAYIGGRALINTIGNRKLSPAVTIEPTSVSVSTSNPTMTLVPTPTMTPTTFGQEEITEKDSSKLRQFLTEVTQKWWGKILRIVLVISSALGGITVLLKLYTDIASFHKNQLEEIKNQVARIATNPSRYRRQTNLVHSSTIDLSDINIEEYEFVRFAFHIIGSAVLILISIGIGSFK